MRYLAMLTIVDKELNRTIRPQHLRYISDLFRDGKVNMAGPFADGSGGLVIYQADSLEEAQALANADPAVSSRARELLLIPWNVLDLPLPEEI